MNYPHIPQPHVRLLEVPSDVCAICDLRLCTLQVIQTVLDQRDRPGTLEMFPKPIPVVSAKTGLGHPLLVDTDHLISEPVGRMQEVSGIG